MNQFISTILVIGAFIILPSACGNGNADEYAMEYAGKLGPGYSSLGCVGSDSDDDGYVSCTIAHPNGERSGIQCASGYSSCTSSGCKEDTGRGYHR